MPRRFATRRASSTASREQQPWCLSKSLAAISLGQSCRVTPKTSWPSSHIIAAATDESTPPLMATATLTAAPAAGPQCRDCGSIRALDPPRPCHRRPRASWRRRLSLRLQLLDPNAATAAVFERSIHLGLATVDVELDPTAALGHIGAPDVGHDFEVLPESVNDRVVQRVAAERQAHCRPRHGFSLRRPPARWRGRRCP